MAGQIIKRGDKTWVVRIFQGRDDTGKRRYINKTVHGTKKDAEKYLNTTLTAISTGSFIQQSSLSLNKYLDDWLVSAAKPRVSERTYAEYAALLKTLRAGTTWENHVVGFSPLTNSEPVFPNARAWSKFTNRQIHTRSSIVCVETGRTVGHVAP